MTLGLIIAQARLDRNAFLCFKQKKERRNNERREVDRKIITW